MIPEMIKFQKFQDEEGNVEFVEHLVDKPSGESNEVYSKEDASRWRSLNYFQKVSVWLMILIVALMFSLLVVVCMKADHSHHNEHVQGKSVTTPGVPSGMGTKQGSPTTRTISSTIHSQRVVSLLMGFTFQLQKPISDMRPSYKTTRKIPGLNDVLFKQSTSTDTSVESKKTVDTEDVHVNTARILATTPSTDKRTTLGNHEIQVLQDRTTTGVSSVEEHTNKSVHDADDSIGKQTSPESVFLTKSSTKNPSTTGKSTTEVSQDKTAVHVPCDKEHSKNSVDADDGGGRGISLGRF